MIPTLMHCFRSRGLSSALLGSQEHFILAAGCAHPSVKLVDLGISQCVSLIHPWFKIIFIRLQTIFCYLAVDEKQVYLLLYFTFDLSGTMDLLKSITFNTKKFIDFG